MLDATAITDPFKFKRLCWPHLNFYDKQAEVIESIARDRKTFVPAGNMLGKDFVAGFIVVWFFISRHPCRIVSTSVDAPHLEVLWGEVKRFIQTSRIPLDAKDGGPIIVNHMHLRKSVKGQVDGLSYAIGRVAAKGEGLQGHHIARTDNEPKTLFICDEASGVDQVAYEMADTWAHRMLIIGNPWPCENFFKWAVKGRPGSDDQGGDVKAPNNGHFLRKVIRIKAEDSPNVRVALGEKARGLTPTNRIIIPGVKPWDVYEENRIMWDRVQQCVSLDADFYQGADNLLFPPTWLNECEKYAETLLSQGIRRIPRAIGIDAGEGNSSTVWTAIDEHGIVEVLSMKTHDTNDIPAQTIAFGKKHKVEPHDWVFDRGGGGKQHADRLRAMGYKVRTVGFGESPTDPKTAAKMMIRYRPKAERIDNAEKLYVYKNRRAEMYGMTSELCDPDSVMNDHPFAIPRREIELRRQLAPLPKLYDENGRLYLPPKGNRRIAEDRSKGGKVQTLFEVLGCSPDEADSLVLAVYGMLCQARVVVGASAW